MTPSPDPLEERAAGWAAANRHNRQGDYFTAALYIDGLLAALTTLREQMEAKDAALRTIRNERKPQVCENYELCTHEGCRASYEAFVIADTALSPTGEPTEPCPNAPLHDDEPCPTCGATGEPTKDDRCPNEGCFEGIIHSDYGHPEGRCTWPGHTEDKTP